MRLILGDNIRRPSIRDNLIIESSRKDLTRKLLRLIGRNQYCKHMNRVKYGGKFGDRLIKFGKSFYNNVITPGFNKVVKPVYNVTKKLVDIAANNDLANNAIKIIGNTVGTALGAPGVGNIISSAIQGADSGIKIDESVVNRLINEKKLDPDDIKQVFNIIKEQIKDFTGKDKQTLETKAETVKNNLENVDLEKENLTKQDIKDGFGAGLIFYNPVSKKPINKYSGRVKMCGSINGAKGTSAQAQPINPNLLKIMPKLFKKKTIQSKSGRVRMSGAASNNTARSASSASAISDSKMNEISNKLEALKAKYK